LTIPLRRRNAHARSNRVPRHDFRARSHHRTASCRGGPPSFAGTAGQVLAGQRPVWPTMQRVRRAGAARVSVPRADFHEDVRMSRKPLAQPAAKATTVHRPAATRSRPGTPRRAACSSTGGHRGRRSSSCSRPTGVVAGLSDRRASWRQDQLRQSVFPCGQANRRSGFCSCSATCTPASGQGSSAA